MLTFDTENYDTDTMHSTSSNTGRLIATTAGKYIIEGQVEFAASATGVRIAQIRLNGSTIIASNRKLSLSTGVTQLGVDTVYNLAANDYVELLVNQTSLGALNADAGLGTTWFGATRQADDGATGATGPTGATGAAGAPTDATYVTQTPNASLSNEQALSALGTGALKSTTGTGVLSLAALDDLSDVVIATTKAGELVAFDGTNFINIRQPALIDAFTPAGALAQTVGRAASGTAMTLTSQQLQLYGIWLPKGMVIASISFLSNTTALSGGTNQLFGIFDDNSGSSSGTARALLRGSNDDGATAWAANAYKTLNLTSTYTTTRAGLHYLGILINATTVPTIAGTTATANNTQAALPPVVGGTSTGTITALPNPAGAISANSRLAHAYVS